MPEVDAVLFDLYDTLVRPDLPTLDAGRVTLAARAGVDPKVLREQWHRTGEARTLGTLGGMEAELAEMLSACGVMANGPLLRELAELEYETWRRGVQLYDDSVPYLRRLRRQGCRLAIVSNCSCQAGAIVQSLGLDREVEAVVLSWEVGVSKPDPAILRIALGQIETPPARALLVDDRPDNLDAALALGLRTALIARDGLHRQAASAHPRISSLYELDPLVVQLGHSRR
jgi:HAD superfamily hydrolase (TIGR01509 family)